MTKVSNAAREQADLKIQISLVNQGGITTRSGPLVKYGSVTLRLNQLHEKKLVMNSYFFDETANS